MQGTSWRTRLSNCSSNRSEKSYVGLNEKFLLTNHDFSKLSIIPDAHLLHEIPEKDELADEKVDDGLLDKGSRLGEWYSGQVFYGFKSMVSEGSSVMRCAAEIADVMAEHFDKTQTSLYVYSDAGLENKTYTKIKNCILPYFFSTILNKS